MENISENIELDIKVGTKFSDIVQFEQHFNNICKQKFVQFFKKDARTIESARKKKIIRFLNPDLKFYSVRWCCIHGGRQFKQRGTGVRKVHTMRQENLCPAHVHLIISDSGNDFIVSSVNNKHNHVVSEQLFKRLPHNRRLPDDIKADTKKLLEMKANKHMLRADLEKKLNKSLTLKDLRNLQQEGRGNLNNMQNVTDKIQSIFDADCHLLIDENDVFKGLFFSSKEMIDALDAYPEMIFFDATYKLLAIKAPVYIFLNIDGNGESNIVGVGILMSEDKASLEWCLQTFKELHPSASKIINIMTDKDITEREVLRACFPNASLHICVFHVLQIFRREITCENFKFASSKKNIILELLQDLVYCKSETKFEEIFEKIKKKCERVANYLMENWIDIKEEWCPFIGLKNKNFMNTTNNRLEGLNSKLKAVIDKHSALEEFIDKLAIIHKSLENEKNSRAANILIKRSTTNYKPGEFQFEYLQLLTPYAFEKLESQFSFNSLSFTIDESCEFYNVKKKDSYLKTTRESCNCYFSNSMGLPCKHIFAIRNYLNDNLFDCKLVLDRWKMSYFIKHCSFLHKQELTVEKPGISDKNMLVVDVLSKENTKKPLTSQEKYRKTFVKAKLVASLASDVCGIHYNNINKSLDIMINNLQNGKYDIFETLANQSDNEVNDNIGCSENDFVLHQVNFDDGHVNDINKENINKQDNLGLRINNLSYQSNCDINDRNSINAQNDVNDRSSISEQNDNNRNSIDEQNDINDRDSVNEQNHINEDNCDINDINEQRCDMNEDLIIENISQDSLVLFDKQNKNNTTNSTTDNKSLENISADGNENSIDLAKIRIPICKKRGRPAGSDITVIGLLPKRKRKKTKFLPFNKKTTKEKIDIILHWILPDTQILCSKQIEIKDLLPMNQIDVRILEVNICILKKYFEKESWEIFKNYRKHIKDTGTWICVICQVIILNTDPSIRCDVCLHWLHLKCKEKDQPLGELMCQKCTY